MKKKYSYIILCVLLLGFLCACDFVRPISSSGAPVPAETPAPTAAPTPEIAPSPVLETPPLPEEDPDNGCVRISEVACKNPGLFLDEENVTFPDYIELENCSDHPVELSGWSLSDGGSHRWALPAGTLEAGEYLLVLADKGTGETYLHCDFSLSLDETLTLYDSVDNMSDSVLCSDELIARGEDGFAPSQFPTPGAANTPEGYEAVESERTPGGALIISEVMCANHGYFRQNDRYRDWIELQNVSSSPIQLSDYCLSDDSGDLLKWRFPEGTLQPGEYKMILCIGDEKPFSAYTSASFKLDDGSDALILTSSQGVEDYVWVRGVPTNCTIGRINGRGGFFYFNEPTPEGINPGSGCRSVADSPACTLPGGRYPAGSALTLELSGEGDIYYTTDGNYPTADSGCLYTQPVEISSTCVLRAICHIPGKLDSRCLSVTYIIGDESDLPTVCITTDSVSAFNTIHSNGYGNTQISGAMEYYGDDGSFTARGGVKLSGATSLQLAKKNITVKFKPEYGDGPVNYDLFGGGVTEFAALTLRVAQGQYYTYMRDELCSDLCRDVGTNVATQRYKYCTVYVNGRYYGLYALKEKINDSYYASIVGGDEEQTQIVDSFNYRTGEFNEDVFVFCRDNDMRVAENYEYISSVLDLDSLIDWTILECYTGNTDLYNGNTRFAKCGDGKWQLIFYDLDCAFRDPEQCFRNIWLSKDHSKMVSPILFSLIRNEDFRARFLRRYAELTQTVLTEENILAHIDAIAVQIENEMVPNLARWKLDKDTWTSNLKYLRAFISDGWSEKAYRGLCQYLHVTSAEKALYFQ